MSRDVNPSPKILHLQKCLNPIGTAVFHPMFSLTVFDRPLVAANCTDYSTLWAYGARISETYCNVHISLFISDSQKTFGMRGSLCICNGS